MPGANQAWRCTVCGYVHRGPEPPLACPVCGAVRELFEPWAEPTSPRSPSPQTPLPQGERGVDERSPSLAGTAKERPGHMVVVGAGIAGISAVESLRTASPAAEITLISKRDRASLLPAQSDAIPGRRDGRARLADPPGALVRGAEGPAPAGRRGGGDPPGRSRGRVARRPADGVRQAVARSRRTAVYPADCRV